MDIEKELLRMSYDRLKKNGKKIKRKDAYILFSQIRIDKTLAKDIIKELVTNGKVKNKKQHILLL